MNGKVFVGQKALSLTEYDKSAPISGVILWVDDENCYEAGDETGTVIEEECPYASQEMANNLLTALKGYSYQGLEANGAKVLPIVELGDGITVGGLYTQLAYQNIRFSTGEVMDVAAPGSDETMHEYKTDGQLTKQFTHQIAETRSTITKTAEEIRLEVENELNGLSSSFTVQLDSIKSEVQGLNNQISSIEQYVDSITLEVSNESTSSTITLKAGNATISSQYIKMNGLVTFTGLSDGTTKINGACLATGTVIADVEVKGSKFSNTSGSAYLEVGGTDYGDMTLYGQGGNRVFRVYDNVGSVSLSGYGVEFLRISDLDDTCYPQGDWDFRSANVSGITATFA